MIGWLLDTNVVAALIEPTGPRSVKNWAAAQPERRLFLSILTFGEYDKAIHNAPAADPARPQYIAARDRLEARFAGRILSVGNGAVRRWGAISGTVKRLSGQAPPVIDTLLAAMALEHDLYFATRNVKDVQHSGAAIFNPWNDDPAEFPLAPPSRLWPGNRLGV